MPCKSESLSCRQIVDEYQGVGTGATWLCRLRHDTRGLRSLVRKVGGSARIERRDLEHYTLSEPCLSGLRLITPGRYQI